MQNARKHFRRGFSFVEITVIVIAIVILAAIIIFRVGNARAAATAAQKSANAMVLQSAFDRAVLYQHPFLTNDSVPLFATNAYNAGLVSKQLSLDELDGINLCSGTHITNRTARFGAGTNLVADSSSNSGTNNSTSDSTAGDQAFPVTFSNPIANGTYYSGQTIPMIAVPNSAYPITEVVFYDNYSQIGAAAVAPYTYSQTFTPGSHALTAVATDSEGRQGQASVTISVRQAEPPNVTLSSTPSPGTLLIGTPVSLQAVASSLDSPGIASLEILQGSTVYASVSGQTTLSQTWTPNVVGRYTFSAQGTDLNNQTASSTTNIFNIVEASPSVSWVTPADGGLFLVNTAIQLGVNAAAGTGAFLSTVYCQGIGNFSSLGNGYTLSYTPTSGGRYALVAEAEDNYGMLSPPTTNHIIVDSPPAVTIISPTNGNAFTSGTVVSLSAAVSDPDASTLGDHVVQVAFQTNAVNYAVINPAYDGTFSTNFTGVAGCLYNLQVIATDTFGVSTTNNSVAFSIQVPSAFNLTPAAVGGSYTYHYVSSGNYLSDANDSLAFDGVKSTYETLDGSGSSTFNKNANGFQIEFDRNFSSPRTLTNIKLWIGMGYVGGQTLSFKVQYSSDGTNWTTAWSGNSVSVGSISGSTELVNWTPAAPIPNVSYVRFGPTGNYSGDILSINELQIYGY